MNDTRPAKANRFIRIVGCAYAAAAAMGVFVCGTQSAVIVRGAPGVAPDPSALAAALCLVAGFLGLLVVSIAFLRRRRWARLTVMVVTGLGIVAAIGALLIPSAAVEPSSAEAPPGYAGLLRMVSTANVLAPLVVCAALAWILWRLRSSEISDQFR